MRSTHTYVVMELGPAAHAEIKAKMLAAGYGHAISGETIDMHGIAVERDGTLAESQAELKRRTGLTVNLTRRQGIVEHVWPPDPSKPYVSGSLADEVL